MKYDDTMDPHFDNNFPKLFLHAWTDEFTLEETFEENLLVNFVVSMCESGGEIESLPKQINKAFMSALEKYGNLIINSFKNFVSTVFSRLCKDEDYNLYLLKFLDSFLEQHYTPEHCALVIELLPNDYMQEEAKVVYKALVKKLLQKNEIVSIRLFGTLKSGSYWC
ncbi:hypothetical protein HHI36_009446 [Cryptolaemus montrouzieri]|uniref:Uncharacterized protein n=1 Tax=Cryptolaemus montrouzieri TaxID=559131 RepID=A0ABD2MFN0_9CUCU